MFAQVIVDVVHTNVAAPFTYRVPDKMNITVGTRVQIPLGRRTVSGFVIELSDRPPQDLPESRIKPVSKALDAYPALLPPLLELAREIAA